MQSSGKSPSPSRFSTVGMDSFSCMRKDFGPKSESCRTAKQKINSAVLSMSWEPSKRSIFTCDKTSMSFTGQSLLFISSVLILLFFCLFKHFFFFSFFNLHLKVSLSACPLRRQQIKHQALRVPWSGGFPAFTSAGRSHKDAMTLLGCDADVSALWVLSVKAVTRLSAAAGFKNMHTCALCCSRTHRGIR